MKTTGNSPTSPPSPNLISDYFENGRISHQRRQQLRSSYDGERDKKLDAMNNTVPRHSTSRNISWPMGVRRIQPAPAARRSHHQLHRRRGYLRRTGTIQKEFQAVTLPDLQSA